MRRTAAPSRTTKPLFNNANSAIAMNPQKQTTSNVLRLSCMYTKQMTKKRKAWSDGILRVTIHNGIYSCTVIDAEDVRGIGLETRSLEPAEVAKFKSCQPFTLTMDNHLVDVSFEPEQHPQASAPNSVEFKFKRFTPPSRFVRQQASEPPMAIDRSNHSGVSKEKAPSTSLDDELDSLWGIQRSDVPQEMPVNHSVGLPSTSRPQNATDTYFQTIESFGGAQNHENKNESQRKMGLQKGLSSVKVIGRSSREPEGFCEWIEDDAFYAFHGSNQQAPLQPMSLQENNTRPRTDASAHFDDIDESIWG